MNDNYDIEHRACFDLPSPGSIIETHYGTEHALDASGYYQTTNQELKETYRRVFEKNTIKDYKPKI